MRAGLPAALAAASIACFVGGTLTPNMASRLWTRKAFTPRRGQLSLLRDVFRAPLVELDLDRGGETAVAAINRWAADATHGHVPQVIASLPGRGAIVLANVAYMTGALRQPFHDEETYDARFTTPPRRTEGLRLVGMAVAESPEWKRKKKAPAAAAPVG